MTQTENPQNDISTRQIVREIRRDHPYLSRIVIITTAVLAIFLILKIVFVILFPYTYLEEPKITPNSYLSLEILKKLTEELDIVGLIAGFTGLGVGIFLTVIVEKQNRFKQKLSEDTTSLIRVDLSQAVRSLRKIVERDEKFQAKENLEEVFDSIEAIFQTSAASKTDVFVMNHSTSFGYLLTFKLKMVLHYSKISHEDLEQFKYWEYDAKRQELVERQQNTYKIMRDIGTEITKNENKVFYVTLNPESKGGTDSPYEKKYLHHLLNSAAIILYDDKSDESITLSTEILNCNNCYLVPKSIFDNLPPESLTDDVIKSNFIEHLLQRQKNEISELKVRDFRITLLNDIPVQVFLSDVWEGNGTCLFMFVNQQTIANSGHELVAFISKNEPYVIESFKNIILQSI